MKLRELLQDVEYQCLQGTTDRDITTLVYDSRKVVEGSVFVCIVGAVRDAHDFAGEVAQKGAAVIIVEREVAVPACP